MNTLYISQNDVFLGPKEPLQITSSVFTPVCPLYQLTGAEHLQLFGALAYP